MYFIFFYFSIPETYVDNLSLTEGKLDVQHETSFN